MSKIICGERHCPNCGKSFTPNGNKQNACSEICTLAFRSITTPSGCREWQGYSTPKGYGEIRVAGKNYRAHRLAWEIENGPIPKGMMLLHSCDNPPCVNVQHLRLGTASENTKDMLNKRRERRGDDCSWSKLTETDVAYIKAELERGERGTQYRLAKRFNVKHTTILKIANGTNWKGVKADPKARPQSLTEAQD